MGNNTIMIAAVSIIKIQIKDVIHDECSNKQ